MLALVVLMHISADLFVLVNSEYMDEITIFKPGSSATETSYKIECSSVASLHMVLSKKMNNKGDVQTARMRGLVCACVNGNTPNTGFLASRPINNTCICSNDVIHNGV